MLRVVRILGNQTLYYPISLPQGGKWTKLKSIIVLNKDLWTQQMRCLNTAAVQQAFNNGNIYSQRVYRNKIKKET